MDWPSYVAGLLTLPTIFLALALAGILRVGANVPRDGDE